MTKDNLPKLLRDSIEQNTFDVDIITKKLKLPWLKLGIRFDKPSRSDIYDLTSSNDWRRHWNYPEADKDSYQVKGWNGNVYFGPADWNRFLNLCNNDTNEHDSDEDCKCRRMRHNLPYKWYVPTTHYLRRQVSRFLPDDEDINLVNSYSLPPGGYVFPHRDYASDGFGLAKIYVALKWGKGNTFGMYGCGEMPINEGDVFLLNNYTLPHWVYNGSNQDRVVIDISANLHSKTLSQEIIKAFKKCFTS